jgi:hypothetical protein
MDKPSYKFTCYPYECSMNSSPNVLIEHTITSKDVTRTDMLVLFQHFLKACGYNFDPNEVIDVIEVE